MSISVYDHSSKSFVKTLSQSITTSTVHNIIQDVIDEDTRQRWVRTRMRLPVTDQTRLLSEGFAADIAHVWSDASMDQQMLLESCSAGKGFLADGTAVWFVSGVDSHVHLQSAVPRERLAALLAYYVLPTLVLSKHVLVEVFLTDHPSLAYLTLVFGFVVSKFLMYIQGVAIETSLTANITDHWLLSVAKTYMVRQITLDFKLFTAGLAGEFEVVRVLARDVYLQLIFVLILVVALAAIKQFRLGITVAGPWLFVFPLDVRVQRRLLGSLEAALITRVHLIDILHFVPAFMRVQRALLRTGEITEIAMFLDG